MWTSAQFDAEQQATLATAAAAAVLAVLAGWQLVRLALGPSNPAAAESMKRIHRPASTLPVLGNTLDAMVYQRERFVDWMSEQSQITGGKTWLMTIAGQPPWYVISSPESYEDLLKRQVNIFERGPTMSYIFKDFLGEGIIAVDGHKWLVQRKTAAHLFSNRMMREVMDKVIIEKAIKFRDVLEFCRQRGTPVSLKSLISRFTSDVFTKIGFGVELNGLDPTNVDVETEHPFIEAIAAMCRLLQARAQSPMTWWRLKRWLNIGDEREAKVHMKVVHDLVHEIILKSFAMKHESLENLAQSKPSEELHAPTAKTGDIISFYIESGLTDPQQLQDMAVNLFFAGKDTTSFSLSWLFVMMNRHPHVLRKIREEIHAKLPELATGEIDAPTMEQLGELTYLEAAVRENLRLNTSMTTRTPNQDTTLSDGTFVPKGSVVYVCHYASARLKSTWGEDAAEYKPERWIDPATGKLIHFSPFKFVTFIAGPRQCPGMRFAILELMTVAAVLLARFDIKTVEDPFDLTYELSVVFPVKGRLMVTVDKAAPLSPAA